MSTLLDVRGQEWTKGEESTRWPLSIHSNALANAIVVKTGPGKLYGFAVYTNNATAQFILVCDAAAVPADGFVPCFPFTVSSSAPLYVAYGDTGRCFDTGIVLCNSSTAVTKTIGSADCWFDAQYLQSMPSASSPNPFVYRSVTLTDAQVKALPVTPAILIPATQTFNYSGTAATLPIVVSAIAFLDSRAGGYTNVDAGADMQLAWGSDESQNVAKATTAGGTAAAILTVFTATRLTWLAFPLTDQDADSQVNDGLKDNALALAMGNAALGALTGGNAANTLTVKIAYTVTHIPT